MKNVTLRTFAETNDGGLAGTRTFAETSCGAFAETWVSFGLQPLVRRFDTRNGHTVTCPNQVLHTADSLHGQEPDVVCTVGIQHRSNTTQAFQFHPVRHLDQRSVTRDNREDQVLPHLPA